MADTPKSETQAQRAKRSGVSISSLYKAAVVIRDGIPELGYALRDGTISVHRARRIARLPKAEQLAILEGRTELPKEVSRVVVGYIAGFSDARGAAADLAKAAGDHSLATRIRRLLPKGRSRGR